MFVCTCSVYHPKMISQPLDRQDFADHCATRIPCGVQRHLGAAPYHRSHIVHCQLGDRIQAFRSGTEGPVLLWISQASKGAPVWVDKGMLFTVSSSLAPINVSSLSIYCLHLFPGELAPCDCNVVSASRPGLICFQTKEMVLSNP